MCKKLQIIKRLVEIRPECINYIQTNIKKINVFENINSFEKKFDVITLFHVLEHLPYQIKTLKVLKSKLRNKGKSSLRFLMLRTF